MMNETGKNDLETTEGVYMGKLYQRDTTTGKKQYKVMFTPQGNPTKQFSFTCYDTTKGFNDMQEGQLYTIGYVTKEPYTNRQGILVSNSKTAMFFSVPQANSFGNQGTGQALPQTSSETPQTQTTQSPVPLTEYIQKYKASVKTQGIEPDMAHALGSYLIDYRNDTGTVKQFTTIWNQVQ